MTQNCPPYFESTGRLLKVQGSIHARVSAAIGEAVLIRQSDGEHIAAEVIGFDSDHVQIMPLDPQSHLEKGDLVIATGSPAVVPVGQQLLGRILNSSGRPIDSLGSLNATESVALNPRSPSPLERDPITQKFETGIRAIDSLLTIGRGQRVGIFAGSGVGKSTLLGNIAKYAEADVNIVALVGERGREVRPFVERAIGPTGLEKSVLIVSTSDESPLARIRAVESAIAIADWFRSQGANVMLMLDSLTRFATAQRELGLLLGEPPTSRGYPPSVFQRMASMLEQLGNADGGSITGLITILVDGDDMNEPVADAARSILDGHIVLSRQIAERNHYPAIDILASISRLAQELVTADHNEDAGIVRKTMALYQQVEDLVQIGAYKPGNMPLTDLAIEMMPHINNFLQQRDDRSPYERSMKALAVLATACGNPNESGGR